MTWLFSSVVATFSGTLLLCLVYAHLYSMYREKYMKVWTWAWGVYSLRFFAALQVVQSGPSFFWQFLNLSSSLCAGMLLLLGTKIFAGRRMPAWWLITAAAGLVWIAAGLALKVSFLALTIPIFTFLALVNIWTGILVFRQEHTLGWGKAITSAALILWGVHIFNYPFLRPIKSFAPWGYLIGSALMVVVALGFLLVYFERVRRELTERELEQRILTGNLQDALNERKHAEDALRESKKLFEELLIHVDLIALMLDREGRVTFCNEKFLQLTGWNHSEILGQNIFTSIVPEDHRGRVEEIFLSSIASGVPVGSDKTEILTRKGGRRLVAWNHTILRNLEGQIVGLASLGEDITERKEIEDRLLESQRRFHELLANISMIAVILDTDGKVVFANDFLLRLSGWTEGEVVGQSWFETFIPSDINGQVYEVYSRTIHQGEFPLQFENEIITRDGDRRLISWTNTLLRNPEGQIVGTASIGEDITERRRIENELRLTQFSVDKASVGIFRIEEDGSLTSVNEQACHNLGYSREELCRMKVWDIDPNFTRESWLEHRKRLRTKQSGIFETCHRRKDGTFLPVEIAVNYVEFQGRQYSFSFARDIEERKKGEEALMLALRETESARQKLNTLLESVADALIVTDSKGVISLVNRAAEELFGTTLVRIKGKSIASFIQEKSFLDHLEWLFAGGQDGEAIDFSLSGQEGVRFLQARTAVIYSGDGIEGEAITLVRDVTREREADRMKSEFISIAAHELRTPLTSIIGYTELLQEEGEFGAFSPEQRREFLDTVQQKAGVLERIIDDLLNLSRIESGRPIWLELKPYNLLAGLKRILADYRMESNHHSFELAFPEEVAVVADGAKIEQVIDNLLSNAIKYSPQGGRIRISGQPIGSDLQVCVEDEGIGMTPYQIERIFDKFYRADTLDTAIGGLGLGMSIVKSIVEAHHGRIWVESTPGKGTRVTFALPIQGV